MRLLSCSKAIRADRDGGGGSFVADATPNDNSILGSWSRGDTFFVPFVAIPTARWCLVASDFPLATLIARI